MFKNLCSAPHGLKTGVLRLGVGVHTCEPALERVRQGQKLLVSMGLHPRESSNQIKTISCVSAPGGQRRVLELLELELQVAVSHVTADSPLSLMGWLSLLAWLVDV